MANALKIPRFVYNRHLCADIFDADGQCRASVHDALLMVADDFVKYMKRIGLETDLIEITDIYIHGGICNYYYDTTSDIDMVLVLDVSKLRVYMGAVPVGPLISGVYRAWRNMTNFSINGRAVDVSVLDVYDDKLTGGYDFVGGIYSVQKNMWIQLPPRVPDAKIPMLRRDSFREFMKIRAMYERILRRNYDGDFIAEYLGHVWRLRYRAYRVPGGEPVYLGYAMARRAGILTELIQKRNNKEQLTPVLERLFVVNDTVVEE